MKIIRNILILLFIFVCGNAKYTQATDTWTLTNDDTSLTLLASNNVLQVTSLLNPTRNWNWIASPTNYPFVTSIKTGNVWGTVNWLYSTNAYTTTNGLKLTLTYTNAYPKFTAVCEWWARTGKGPIRTAMTITNLSGQSAIISNIPSLYLPVVGDTNLQNWYVHSDGDFPDTVGFYNNNVTNGYSTNLLTMGNLGYFIPFAALATTNGTNGHGIYIGTEWSAAQTYIQGTSTTNVLLESDGYQEGRTFAFTVANNAFFIVPPAFVGAYSGDYDDGGNSLKKYLWDYNMPDVVRTNTMYPLIQWNCFHAVWKNAVGNYETLQWKYNAFVDSVAPLGFEEIMHDIGWNYYPLYGTDPSYDCIDWPYGVKSSFDYAKSKGIYHTGLYLAGPQNTTNISYLFSAYGANSWRSDMTAGYALGDETNITYTQILNFYNMVDSLYTNVLGFEWENCQGGGRIKDFGAMKRTARIFGCDRYIMTKIHQAFYDGSYLFPPAQIQLCGMNRPVGVNGTLYAFRTALLGSPMWAPDSPDPLGGSWSYVLVGDTLSGGVPWTRAEKAAVAASVTTYKARIRPIIRDCNMYHLTSRPSSNATDWIAYQYDKYKLNRGITYVFRSASNNTNSQSIVLKGLDSTKDYVLTFWDSTSNYIRSGSSLMSTGFTMVLPSQTQSELMFYVNGIALTKPAEGTVYTAPATIPLESLSTPTNASITSVDFYSGTNLIQSVTTAASGTVYQCVWSNIAAGNYAISARLYTNSVISSTSDVITVRVNTPPVITNSSTFYTTKNVPVSIIPPGILNDDFDSETNSMLISTNTLTAHGTVLVATNGSFTYTPSAEYVGSDSFTYYVSDWWSTSGPATEYLSVLAPTPNQMKITFSGYTNKTEVLTNFPVLIVLSNNISNSGFTYRNFTTTTGYDLRFGTSTNDTTNSLNYEIESWDPNGASFIWVQVPTITGNGLSSIWANWGDTNAMSQLPCTTNGSVWSNNYVAVWHMATSSGVVNAQGTVSGVDAVRLNNAGVNGILGSMSGVAGSSMRIATITNAVPGDYSMRATNTASLQITNRITLSAWVNLLYVNPNASAIISKRSLTAYGSENYSMWINANGSLHFELQNPINTYMNLDSQAGVVSTNQWTYLTFAVNENDTTSRLKMYVNGAMITNFTSTAYNKLMLSTGTDPVCLGNYYGGPTAGNGIYHINGDMDEARISPLTHSSNWIWACYMNQGSNTVFTSYGGVSGGGTSVSLYYLYRPNLLFRPNLVIKNN